MGKSSNPPESDAAVAARHRAARVLSELLMADSDGDLAEFLRRRVERPAAVDLAGLRLARDVLEALGRALQGKDGPPWKQVEEAWQLLCAGADAPPLVPAAGHEAGGGTAGPAAGSAPPSSALADRTPMHDIPLDRTVPAVSGDHSGTPTPFDAPSPASAGDGAPGTNESPASEEAAGGLAGSLPELTVEQYASYRATCDVFPERLATTHRQYSVTTAELRSALDAHWHQRFASDGALRGRYQTLLSKYVVWLRKQR